MTRTERINSFLFTLFGFKRARSRGHILLLVLIHTACWCILFFLPLLLYPLRITDRWFLLRELIDKSVLVTLFYLNYYILIPRLIERKRYLAYASLVFLAFCFYFAQHIVIRAYNFSNRVGPFRMVSIGSEGTAQARNLFVIDRESKDGSRKASGFMLLDAAGLHTGSSANDSNKFSHLVPLPDSIIRSMPAPFAMRDATIFGIPRGAIMMALNNATSSFVLVLLIGGFIRLAYSFIRNQNEKKVLENANLNAEITFLRSQINPHFLFNTLNSIYAQAHSRSEKTEFSVLKLSELLRYVLYDSGEEVVELEKDIQYINNYIDLQRLRLSPRIQLDYSVTGPLEEKSIAPLLLINFIENAFKHGISYAQPSRITISISIFEKILTLTVINPIVEKDSFARGGLGLKNVTRRLELLYPGRHHLAIDHRQDLHIVNLKLDLSHA